MRVDPQEEDIMAYPKKLKVGIVMGGGVSLGSFTGGALAEITRQLRDNLNPELYSRAEIDVLSGASAGGMTLAMLLRVLANPEGFPDEKIVQKARDSQYDAWVDKIDIKNLIPKPNMKIASLLDRNAVDDIAEELLLWQDGKDPNPILLAPRVCLGISLFSYNGLPIITDKIEALKDAKSTTLYWDYRIFCLDFVKQNSDPPNRWMHYDLSDIKKKETWQERKKSSCLDASKDYGY